MDQAERLRGHLRAGLGKSGRLRRGIDALVGIDAIFDRERGVNPLPARGTWQGRMRAFLSRAHPARKLKSRSQLRPVRPTFTLRLAVDFYLLGRKPVPVQTA
ncbi:MAG TPA: hypothetical protein VGB61_05760, partial [Pyrinomonadaceae bacterium]